MNENLLKFYTLYNKFRINSGVDYDALIKKYISPGIDVDSLIESRGDEPNPCNEQIKNISTHDYINDISPCIDVNGLIESVKNNTDPVDYYEPLEILLTIKDLLPHKRFCTIDNVTINDFRTTRLTKEQIHKAEYILYVDGNETKVLKSRY